MKGVDIYEKIRDCVKKLKAQRNLRWVFSFSRVKNTEYYEINSKGEKIMKRNKLKEYWKETIKNKIIAVLLVLLTLPILLIEKDGTCTLFMLVIGIPLFFAKKNYIL